MRDKKCTKKRDARAELLLCSVNLLFFDVPVGAVVVVFRKVPNEQNHSNVLFSSFQVKGQILGFHAQTREISTAFYNTTIKKSLPQESAA